MRAATLAKLLLASATLPVYAQTARPGAASPLVVSTEWLAAHLGDPRVVILHVGDQRGYEAKHIPGARRVDVSMFATEEGPMGRELETLPPAEMQQRLESLGVSDSVRVIVYAASDEDMLSTTRILFTLYHHGLGARSALVDGGLARWTRDGRMTSAEAVNVTPAHLTPLGAGRAVVDAAFVQAHIRKQGFTIIDARAPVYFTGPPQMGMKGGHIPGAVSIPFSTVFTDDRMVRSDAELRDAFRLAGVRPGDTLIVYCHLGLQATAVVLASRLLGYDVRLYDGSFHDWSARAELPVEGAPAK
jgi:thiosulfate/3-mercaptopyruvate sulfurtransferase